MLLKYIMHNPICHCSIGFLVNVLLISNHFTTVSSVIMPFPHLGNSFIDRENSITVQPLHEYASFASLIALKLVKKNQCWVRFRLQVDKFSVWDASFPLWNWPDSFFVCLCVYKGICNLLSVAVPLKIQSYWGEWHKMRSRLMQQVSIAKPVFIFSFQAWQQKSKGSKQIFCLACLILYLALKSTIITPIHVVCFCFQFGPNKSIKAVHKIIGLANDNCAQSILLIV